MNVDYAIVERIFAIEKRIIPGNWLASQDSSGMEYGRKILCNLSANDTAIDHFVLRARMSSGSLDKVTIQLDFGLPTSRLRAPVYRLDLNPTSPHSNGLKPGDPDSGRIIQPGTTHEHSYRDRLSDARPDGFGRPVLDQLTDFGDAIAFVCATLNIVNPGDFPAPKPQGILL